MEIATFGGGCFWCTEGVFKEIKGVKEVVSGYSGGHVENPSDRDVYTEATGHAESIQISFDPKEISYKDLIYIFFKTHDPTSMNQQGYDVGNIYRSIIFYHSKDQQKTAEELVRELQKEYSKPIVTEIVPYKGFYKAEDYHQDFYAKNPNKPYCMIIIDPKIKALRKNFSQFLKN